MTFRKRNGPEAVDAWGHSWLANEELTQGSAAAADRHVIHHAATAATCLHHGRAAVAAGLDHRTAVRITTGAGDAHPLLCGLTLAHTHNEVAAADHHAV